MKKALSLKSKVWPSEPWIEVILAMGLLLGGVAVSARMSLGFTLPKMIIFEAVFLILAIIFCVQKQPLDRLWKSWSGRWALSYFSLLAAYTVFSIAPWTSLWGGVPQLQGLLTQAIYFAALCVGLATKGSLSRVIVPMNAIIVFYGAVQMSGLDPWATAWQTETLLGRTYSTLGNPNFLGAFLVLTLPCLVESLRSHKKTLAALLMANVAVLIGTASRGALIGLIGAGIVAAMFYRKELHQSFKVHRKAWLATSILFLLIGGVALDRFQERYTTASEMGRSLGARQVIWQDTITLIAERPWGYGLEALTLVYGKVQSPELLEYEKFIVFIDRAHTVLLDIWVTAGPLTLAVWLLFMGRVLKRGLKNPSTRLRSVGLLAYLFTLMVSFETLVVGVIAWLLLGSVIHDIEPPEKASSLRISQALWSGVALMLMLTLPITVQHARADLAYTQAEKSLNEGKIEEALEGYAQAVSTYSENRTHLLKTIEVALIVLEEDLSEEERRRLTAFTEETLNKLMELTGGKDAFTHLLQGWFSYLRGQTDGVESLLDQGKALAPYHPLTYKLRAHVYELMGRPDKATEEIETLKALMPTYLEDEFSDATRIFWKENAWLEKLIMVK